MYVLIYAWLDTAHQDPVRRVILQMVPEKQKQAADQRESFAELAKEVQGYKVKIQNAVTRADQALQKEIGDAEAKKTRLQGEVTECACGCYPTCAV